MNYQDIINNLASDDYYKVKRVIYSLINDAVFIKQIISHPNPLVFDRFIKMVEYKMDTSLLHERRNNFIKKVFDGINSDNCYIFFGLDKNNPRSNVIANRYLAEYIINYFFQDNYYNFMTNFYQMISYLSMTDKNIVDKNNINLYDQFVKIKDLSMEEKIDFFKKYVNDSNLMELFYDDMDLVKNDSHKQLVEASLKLNRDSELHELELSKKLGIDVYVLDGQEFYGFVRCFSLHSNNFTNQENYIYSKGNRLGYSFSYISNNNIGTTDYDEKWVTLFYDNIDYHDIMYVHHADLHSKNMINQDDYLSQKENEIVTPKGLMANTKNYNEVYIKAGSEGIKPTALICYDSISINEVAFATKYDLSILVINRQKYKRYETYDDDYDSYSYVI